MKKFSKLFLSCAAVAAVTAAVATSAMAAGEVSATYTPAADGATTASLKITTNYTADQKTLLIVPSSVTLDKVSADDVVQIDQNADIVDVVLPANLKDGKYTVYMGGDGQVYSTNFKVGNASSVLVGDVTQDEEIDLSDATAIVNHFVKIETVTGDALIAADVNYDDEVDLSDATCVVNYFVKMPSGTGHAGETK
jgi:methionine-rich copper-binding protein CopC